MKVLTSSLRPAIASTLAMNLLIAVSLLPLI